VGGRREFIQFKSSEVPYSKFREKICQKFEKILPDLKSYEIFLHDNTKHLGVLCGQGMVSEVITTSHVVVHLRKP